MCNATSPLPSADDSPLLRTEDAARYLLVSQRKLWGLQSPRGPIETVKIGRRVMVLRASLDAFIKDRTVHQHCRETEPSAADPAVGPHE